MATFLLAVGSAIAMAIVCLAFDLAIAAFYSVIIWAVVRLVLAAPFPILSVFNNYLVVLGTVLVVMVIIKTIKKAVEL